MDSSDPQQLPVEDLLKVPTQIIDPANPHSQHNTHYDILRRVLPNLLASGSKTTTS
jgi:hypothetical protein